MAASVSTNRCRRPTNLLVTTPRNSQADRNLDGADCVLWYTLGLTHVVRTEVRAAGS